MLSRLSFPIAVAALIVGGSAISLEAATPVHRAASPYTYTLVTEPDQGLTPIYNFIGTAKKTIDMTMYEFTDTQGEQLLAQAAAAGVTVRVILDQNREKSSNQAAYTYLSQNGVQVHWANPTYAATHQKTITVDGATSAIMTLNLTSQYYSTSRDFAVIENDPNDVAAIEQTFNADFTNAAITPPNGDDLVWSPTNSQSALLALINSAQHCLLIENEEMSDTNVVNALVSAASRGVLVQIVMTNDANEYASEFNQIVAAGGEISTYAETASLYIHAKVILADYGNPAAQVFIGSENFSNASLTENRELGLTISNAAIMASIYGTLTSDFTGGTPWSGSQARFSIETSPSSLTVNAGSSVTATVTTQVFDGFNSAIALSASGLPAGATASFSPSSIAAPGAGSSTMKISVGASTAAGAYAVTVTGKGGGLTETAGLTLTVGSGSTPDFTISASPTSLTVNQSASGATTITTAVSGGFNAAIALSASGLPAGASASFNPTSIAAPGSGSSALTISVGATAAVGTYTVTVMGTGGGVTHAATVSLTVASGGGGGSQLIVDGGFEAATKSGNTAPGWTATTNISGHNVILYKGTYPHTGTNLASEGGYNNDNDTLTQTVTIPSSITAATLTFWVNVVTNETTTSTKYDYLYVEIHNSSGTKLATPLTLSNLDNKSSNNKNGTYFQPPAVDLTAYKGKTVEVVFHATTDYEKTTTFRIDDVSLTTK